MPQNTIEFETPETPTPNAPPVTQLAEDSPPRPASTARQRGNGAGPDTAGIDQFLKAQIGSERYKQISAKAAAEDPPADMGSDGKFLKSGVKPQKDSEKKVEAPTKGKTPSAVKPSPFKPKASSSTVAPLTAEQIVAAASEGAARALTSQKDEKTVRDDAAAKQAEPKLGQEQQETAEILAKMEELKPEKYKGISSKYRNSIAALEKYSQTWEADHPGQEFDEESPEHEDFFKKNDVDWSDLDFQKAIARLESEDVSKITSQKTDGQLAELKRAETLRAKQGEIASEQNTAALAFWRELGDDYADVVNQDGTLNMAKVSQLKESDAETLNLHITAAQALDLEVAEIYKLFNRLVDNDPQGNPVHRNINQFADEKEQALASKPIQEKLNAEGQQFLPASQYYKLSKAERDQYWTFSAKDISFLRAADLATITRKRVEINEQRHREWAKSRGLQLDDLNAKPESPSSGGEPRMAAVADGTPKKEPAVQQNFLRMQLRGS